MKLRARISLFLMEQLVAVTVFAVCAAVCVWIFAESFYTAMDARDINYALIAAKNGAETYKMAKEAGETAKALGGQAHSSLGAAVYYDENWQVCGEGQAVYVLLLTDTNGGGQTAFCRLSVARVAGEEIVAFTVAARGGDGGG